MMTSLAQLTVTANQLGLYMMNMQYTQIQGGNVMCCSSSTSCGQEHCTQKEKEKELMSELVHGKRYGSNQQSVECERADLPKMPSPQKCWVKKW